MSAVLIAKDLVKSTCGKSVGYITLKAFQMEGDSKGVSALHSGKVLLIM